MYEKKIIFFTGGVYSSIGKGITLSSVGKILSHLGFKISVLKLDPYLNINSGQLSPNQHGEVFVTRDGEETDLDLGHYERFLDIGISKHSCYTAGKIYDLLLEKDRSGSINGATIQVIPDVINTIHSVIEELIIKEPDTDFLLIEIGGTIGDIESIPFITAARHLVPKFKKEKIMFLHIVPAIYLKNTEEFKSKPAQHSINHLLSLGISPNLVMIKSEKPITFEIIQKISNNSSILPDQIIESHYQDNIYTLPNDLFRVKAHEKILEYFNIEVPKKDISEWTEFTDKISVKKRHSLRLLIVGKYVKSPDAYLSIEESFKFAAIQKDVDLDITLIDSEDITDESKLKGFDLMCVPHGFGCRGVSGKMMAIKYARENKIPWLGICFGLQLACIEYAINVLNLKGAHSTEIDPDTPHPIIVPWTKETPIPMRLGNKSVKISESSCVYEKFNKPVIEARHRHKYTFNKDYTEQFLKSNMLFTGFSDDEHALLEMIELKDHPFFVAVQWHPEFDTRPTKEDPLFGKLMEAAISHKYKV